MENLIEPRTNVFFYSKLSPICGIRHSLKMPKIGESLEQKRNTVTQGLNRIIYLINMLQKDNFKRLIKINLFAVDFWARKIIRLLSSLTVNR